MIIKSLQLLVPLLISIVLIFAAKVIDDPFETLIKKTEEYVKNNPQEKIHLHLDKPYYAIGDDIWFKAYIIDTRTSAPSTLSGALYVELIDEQDSIKRQLKLPVAYGLGWGDFKLTDSLREGNYRIRAYTQLMRNTDPEFFYDKTIKIGNSWTNKVFTNTNYLYHQENGVQHINATIQFTDKNKTPYAANAVIYEIQLNQKSIARGKATTNENGEVSLGFSPPKLSTFSSGRIIATVTLANKQKIITRIPLNALSNEVDVQFFPEGGNLVEKLPSKIGIKALGSNGLGKNVDGSILDDEGTEITRFKTTRLGMDHIVMSPQPGRTYTAQIRFEDGSEKSFSLPIAEKSGYVLSANNTSQDNILVKIMTSADLLNKGELKLIAQHNGNIYMVSRAVSSKQFMTVSIPKKNLPSGIIQLTLFSPENQPVGERLVFVSHQNDQMTPGLKSDKTSYTKRQEVKMSLSSIVNNKPVQGSFSVSVTSMASVLPDRDNESNILTSLLLTSDLAGYVEKPNTYFNDHTPENGLALDNLLLTQGWRRILWKNILGDTAPGLRFKPERSLTISGKVTRGAKKPIPNARVLLMSTQDGFFMIDTVTDASGRFTFDKLTFSDSIKFVVQARYGKDKKFAEVAIDQVPGQIVTHNKNTGDVEVNVNESIQAYLIKSENFFEEQMRKGLLTKSIQLNEVKIVAEKPNAAKNSSNLNGPGKADYVFDSEMIENSSSISMFLRGRVPGITFIRDQPYLSRSRTGSPMLVIVDGMPIFGLVLDDILPSDVESIEVLRGHYAIIYGRSNGGVIIITTKFGFGKQYNSYTPGLVTHSPKGYYVSRQFYSPKYDATMTSTDPDHRPTVYWNPNVTTDATGQGTFSFFNTDEPGEYRVVIEGIESSGKPGRQVYTYEVR